MWVNVKMNAVRDSRGKTKYQLGLIEDVTSERENTAIIKTIDKIGLLSYLKKQQLKLSDIL